MEWLQWLQSPMGAVISALGGWIAIDAAATHLSTLLTIGSIIKAVWNWVRGKRPDSNESQRASLNLTREIHNANSALTDSQQVIGDHDVVIGKIMDNAQVHIGDAITHDNRKTVNNWKIIKKIFQNDRKRPAPQETLGSQKRRVAGLDVVSPDIQPVGNGDAPPGDDMSSSSTPDGWSAPAQEHELTPIDVVQLAEPEPSLSTAIVPVLTPQESQLQANSESDGTSTSPASATDASAESSNDTASATNNRTVIEAAMSTDAGVASGIALIEPAMPLDTDITPGTDTVSDADLPPSREVVDVLDEASSQARVEEAGESAHNQTHLTDQPATENLDPDNPQNANAGAFASIAAAITVTHLTSRTYKSDPPFSDEHVSDGDLASLPSAQTTEAEADTIDRDIADIANNWPASAISATLQRLRQAHGLLPTDVSYDAGWVIAFEEERWYMYRSDRQCFIMGVRTYLKALGMTPAELRWCLQPLTGHE